MVIGGNETHVAGRGGLLQRVRVFIGSASESVHVAEALQSVLQDLVEVTLWADAFNVGEYSVDDLREAAALHDFAVFVFTADDEVSSRGTTTHAPRDNVVFELGLFSSRLGPRRTFVLKPEGESIKVPSDIAGITYATYRPPDAPPSDARWDSAVRPAARRIRRAIDRAREQLASAPSDAVSEARHPDSAASPSELLAADLLSAARQRALPPIVRIERGVLVVHPLLGVGQVVGYDPPDIQDRMIRVRFSSGIAFLDQAELAQAVLGPQTTASD